MTKAKSPLESVGCYKISMRADVENIKAADLLALSKYKRQSIQDIKRQVTDGLVLIELQSEKYYAGVNELVELLAGLSVRYLLLANERAIELEFLLQLQRKVRSLSRGAL